MRIPDLGDHVETIALVGLRDGSSKTLLAETENWDSGFRDGLLVARNLQFHFQ